MDTLVAIDHREYDVEELTAEYPLARGAFFVSPILKAGGEENHFVALAGIGLADSNSGMMTQFIGDDFIVRAADYFNELRQTEEDFLVVTLVPNTFFTEEFQNATNAMSLRLTHVYGWDPDDHNLELMSAHEE